jgi:hypothetical protein
VNDSITAASHNLNAALDAIGPPPRCTCDTINEPGFLHRPWCGLNHKHPGPHCVGLCEPAEGT